MHLIHDDHEKSYCLQYDSSIFYTTSYFTRIGTTLSLYIDTQLVFGERKEQHMEYNAINWVTKKKEKLYENIVVFVQKLIGSLCSL